MSRIGDDPFATPPELRDPARRLRGQLPAPVTVWTATGSAGDLGLTISSMLVAEGEPPEVLGLLGPLSDLLEAIRDSRRFVVHVLGAVDWRLAETFAGRYPGSDPFAGVEVTPTPYGPRLEAVASHAACALTEATEVGYGVLVRATIEGVDLAGTPRPLAYFRGEYRSLGGPPSALPTAPP